MITKQEIKASTAKSMADRLKRETKQVKDSGVVDKHLRLKSKFHKYSWNNISLIYSQKEDATLLRGYKGWEALNRRPLKNSGIRILRPNPYNFNKKHKDGTEEQIVGLNFKWTSIFDVSDTVVIDESKPDPVTEDLVSLECEGKGEFLPYLTSLSKEMGIEISIVDGLRAMGVSYGGRVSLDSRHNGATIVNTAWHEVGHELLDHHGNRREKLSLTQREWEAETFAFIMCMTYGLENKSAEYLAFRDDCDLTASMPTIFRAVKETVEKANEFEGKE